MKNLNQPAFPTDVWTEGIKGFQQEGTNPGLTKREYIAARAMQGLLSGDTDPNTNLWEPEYLAKQSVAYADALLAELENQPTTAQP